MALDPDIAAQVAHLFDATLAQILSGEIQTVPPAAPMLRDDVDVETAEIPGAGGPVPVRVYRPRGSDVTDALPALVWAHGGGWMYGDLAMPEADSVAQVAAATVPVRRGVGRLPAGARPHPPRRARRRGVGGPVGGRRGGGHGIDPSRVALGGASAGAHLAACAGVRPMRDRLGGAVARLPGHRPRRRPLSRGPPSGLPAGHLDRRDRRSPTCSPATWDATPTDAPPSVVPADADLVGLPPILVTTAECDGLAPQGAALRRPGPGGRGRRHRTTTSSRCSTAT